MTVPAPLPPLDEDEYLAIEASVLGTARGRWFLDECARRLRRREAQDVMAALARLERAVAGEGPAAECVRLRAGVLAVVENLQDLSWRMREANAADDLGRSVELEAKALLDLAWPDR